jgi:chemotaxis signal transduction protein
VTESQNCLEKAASAEVEMLTFRLANQQFGIEMSSIREIVRLPPITRVPLSPAYVLGVANLRGSVTPVLHGSARLGRARGEFTKSSRVLVLAVGGSTLGFSVDEVNRIVSVRADQIGPASAEESQTSASIVSGMIQHAGATIFKISPEQLAEGEGRASEPAVAISARPSAASLKTEAARKVVVIQIGNEEFGIDIGLVSEVIRHLEPTAAPNAPAHLAGLITLRSEAIPVIDLRALMHRASLREETCSAAAANCAAELRESARRPRASRRWRRASFAECQPDAGVQRECGPSMPRRAGAKKSAELHARRQRLAGGGRNAETAIRMQELAERLAETRAPTRRRIGDRRVLMIETDGARFGSSRGPGDAGARDVPLSMSCKHRRPSSPQERRPGSRRWLISQNPPRLVLLLNLAKKWSGKNRGHARTRPRTEI